MERHSGFIEFNGDGVTTIFSIPHGCSFEPHFISTEQSTTDALGQVVDLVTGNTLTNAKSYTASTSVAPGYITLTHQFAPPLGVNNLGYYWSAECR